MNEAYVRKIVLQPTSLCNLNCTYCYLSNRQKNLKMSPDIVSKVVEYALRVPNIISIVWHGGEPLACGYQHFLQLIEPFASLEKEGKIIHYIQTNATLIDDNFCDLFLSHNVHVGISLDGPIQLNRNRLDWAGKESFSKIMKGVQLLKEHSIPFSVIAVVNRESLTKAGEIYKFFSGIGCHTLGINIEEKEGLNQNREISDDIEVTRFWEDLFKLWTSDPIIEIREFRHVLSWAEAVLENRVQNHTPYDFDMFPSVAWNGDVTVLSPEFLGEKSEYYKDFLVGNVLSNPLETIIARSLSVSYVVDYELGVQECLNSCAYFSFCRGGQASNKFFELGSTKALETAYCRNSKQRLVDAVLQSL